MILCIYKIFIVEIQFTENVNDIVSVNDVLLSPKKRSFKSKHYYKYLPTEKSKRNVIGQWNLFIK